MESARHGGTKAVLKFSAIVVLVLWTFLWFMRPLDAYQKFWTPAQAQTRTKAYYNGPQIVVYCAPIIFAGIATALAYHHKRKQAFKIKNSSLRAFRSNPETYPLFIRGPLSIVSAADFLFLCALVLFTVYTFTAYYIRSVNSINRAKLREPLWHKKLEIAAVEAGLAGLFCMAILFFPVTRGSTLLRLLNIPFEHAVKYHIWIGITMLVAWTVHGLLYIIYWIIEKKIHELWAWHSDEISGLSGLIALIIGLVMWATSIGWVRKANFELFYYTHHLYILFILFFGLHLGDRFYAMVLGGVMLFAVNRLLRFVQSRQKVDVMGVRVLSSETIELVFAKEPELHYSAASFVFLNLPAISKLDWHPFTVISSSNVETDRLTLLIKKNGDWTSKIISMIQDNGGSLQLEAGIEGPYGHNLDYISRYQVLVFIAGGSGISPFLSMLKDILYSIQAKSLTPPKDIILVYTVKTSDELHILNSITPALICPEFAHALNIKVQAYVTREQAADLEQNNAGPKEIQLLKAPSIRKGGPVLIHAEPSPKSVTRYAAQQLRAISPPLAGRGVVEAAVIFASFFGFMFLAGIIGRFWIYRHYTSKDKDFDRSLGAFLAFLESLFGVIIAGAAIAYVANSVRRKKQWTPSPTTMTNVGSPEESLKPVSVHYGHRPDFASVFAGLAKSTINMNVGVFACGPMSMQEGVAALCQEYRKTAENATYNYHSLNFDL
ncbi:hypothetical protein SELMODRAFT_416159 [Selaginella moellendorffii]|uniref:FAD-binding FR-type domain-containing protein n=1 Tax=Selaginella moellendorffii TaxID=88036 RepID=D8RYA0_SELML|nr:hypothetical protein SELMODRAFT_416159 [Selaginella moellendorffii]